MTELIVISGVFTTPEGVPFANVRIGITLRGNTNDSFRKLNATQITDSEGRYSFELLPGEYDVAALYPNGKSEILGTIFLLENSQPGTLNDYLVAFIPGPNLLKEMTAMLLQMSVNSSEALMAASFASESKEGAKFYSDLAEGKAGEASLHNEQAAGRADASRAAANDSIAARDKAKDYASQAEVISDTAYTFKTIAAGIAGTVTGQYFRVPGGPDDLAAFYYYLNDNGSAVQVSQTVGAAAVDKAIQAANKSLEQSRVIDRRTQGYGVEKNVYDTEGALIGGGFFDAKGASPMNYTENGDVNITGTQFKNIPNHPEYDWAQTDKNNVPYIGGSKMGGVIIGRVEIVEIPGPPGVVFVDKNYIPYAADPSYETDLNIPVIGGSATPPSPLTSMFRFYDYLGVRSEGQSLSLGAANPGDNPYPMSTIQKYGNKGFSKNNNSDTTDTDTLVPLVEKRYQPTEGTWPGAETPVTGATNKLVEMTQAETGLTFEHQPCAYIGSAPGTGGQPIINLIKGTAAYSRSLDHTRNSLRLAAAESRTFAELAAIWRQGESDYRDETSRDVYLQTFLQYLSDYRADKKAITGQLFDLIFISYQLSTHRAYRRTNPSIALALRDAALLGKTDIAYPGYIGDYYESDHIHGMPETYFMFSQYEGRLIYKMRKDMLEGVTGKMHRLDVIDEIRQGIFTTLYFNVPVPPLVFDTEWVSAAENMGFYIRDKFSLDVIEIITSVDIAGPDRVRITTSRPLLDNEIVTYGWGKAGDPMTNGRQTGPRGNLRDSEGDLLGESYTDGAGVLRKLHNWCVIF